MATIIDALNLYTQAKSLGKSSKALVSSLHTFATERNLELTHENLLEWIMVGAYRKGTRPSSSRMTFARSLVRFTNSTGLTSIEWPMNNIRKEKELVCREKMALTKSPVSNLLEAYIEYKRSGNAMSDNTHQCLRFFNDFCAKNYNCADNTYQEMVNGWCVKRDTERPSSFNKRIAPIRSFLKYVNRQTGKDIALPSYMAYERKKFIPHPFTEDELHLLFEQADTIYWHDKSSVFAYNVRKMVMPVLFRLLYSTGMRTCEARMLSCDDVDLVHGVINIRQSKGVGEHRVALHQTMWDLMKQYDTAIRQLLPEREPFFPNELGRYLPRTWEAYHFKRVWKKVSDKAARLYDLRSNYAVANINGWENVGPEWFDKLLYLSRSMGHSTIGATTYYYNLVPVFADQVENLSGEGFEQLLPDLTSYYNEED